MIPLKEVLLDLADSLEEPDAWTKTMLKELNKTTSISEAITTLVAVQSEISFAIGFLHAAQKMGLK